MVKPAWDGTTWDNMAMFDNHGYALQSLNVFKGMLNDYTSPDKINYAPLKEQTTTVTTPPFNSSNSSLNDSSNSNQTPAETATSNVQYKVTAIYNAPGVDNITVPNALKVGDIVKDMPSSVTTSVSGTKSDKFSSSNLSKVANSIGSNNVDGTQLQKSVQYPNGNGHYYYKYYVQQGYNAASANENVTYGSPITVTVTATLTWTAD